MATKQITVSARPKKAIEIMAPAGSFENLRAAIQGGANAVYFGAGHLNMRAKSANNFELSDFPEIVRVAHENDVRTYLAVNTVLYDHDLKLMRKIMDAAREAQLDAVIATDMAALQYARQVGLEAHISTQLNVSNIEAVRFFAQYADVMVLARELSLSQVKRIVAQIEEGHICGPSGKPVQIELFVHGALCMAISGKCYLSLHEYNSSANRGACLQTCRRSYTVTDNETGYALGIDNEYIMSPKDLSTIGFLDKVIDAGVGVFKIEGRARPAEYVKTVSACYREAADAVLAGTYTKEKIMAWEERLKSVFNRDFWDGYYLGRKLGEWTKTYGSRATQKKTFIGRGQNYFGKIGVAELRLEAGGLKRGDKILITGPTTGAMETTVEEIRLNDTPVGHAPKGAVVSVPVPAKIRRSDKIFLMEPQ